MDQRPMSGAGYQPGEPGGHEPYPQIDQFNQSGPQPYPYQMMQAEPEPGFVAALKAKAGRLVNYGGAAMSLALILGLCVWGYRITMRDVAGVPVVRAIDGPMRVAPEDPGGEVADHTGLAVNNVAADGGPGELADEIALAPPPARLTEEDLPIAALAAELERDLAAQAARDLPEELTPTVEQADAELQSADLEVAVSLSPDVDPNDPVAVALAMANQVANGATPLEAPAEPEISAEAKRLAKLPGVKRSLLPKKRPADLAAPTPEKSAPTSPAENTQLASTNPQIALPNAIPAGTRLVQLGAFDTPEDAAAIWAKLQGRFETLMLEKSRVIMEAQSGGRVFYRLRAQGFADLSDARRFCAALVAEKADCIPVVAR